MKTYVVVQFEMDNQFDIIHKTWLNEEQDTAMYPTDLKGKTMLEVVSSGISVSDTSYKFKPYKITNIYAMGSEYIN